MDAAQPGRVDVDRDIEGADEALEQDHGAGSERQPLHERGRPPAHGGDGDQADGDHADQGNSPVGEVQPGAAFRAAGSVRQDAALLAEGPGGAGQGRAGGGGRGAGEDQDQDDGGAELGDAEEAAIAVVRTAGAQDAGLSQPVRAAPVQGNEVGGQHRRGGAEQGRAEGGGGDARRKIARLGHGSEADLDRHQADRRPGGDPSAAADTGDAGSQRGPGRDRQDDRDRQEGSGPVQRLHDPRRVEPTVGDPTDAAEDDQGVGRGGGEESEPEKPGHGPH